MSFDATIDAHPVSDAAPWWESLGHKTFDDAFRSAEEHIRGEHPGDRLVPAGADGGQSGGWSIVTAAGEKVAVLTIDRRC